MSKQVQKTHSRQRKKSTVQNQEQQKDIKRYKEKEPEIVFEWTDQETGAKGWVVINSLRGGAAGGGTRMRKGLNKEEVISLAKVIFHNTLLIFNSKSI